MAKKTYSRDARSPVPKDVRVSALMSRITAKNTGPELALRKALSAADLRGYRVHYAKVAGKPDVAFVGRKVAVFVQGCFWHSCPHCQPRRPTHNKRFWEEKLDRNKARDLRNDRALRKADWRVITIWECRLRKFPASAVRRVERALAAGSR